MSEPPFLDAVLESGFISEPLILFEPLEASTILTKLQFFIQGRRNFCCLGWNMQGLVLPALLCLHMATRRIHAIGSPVGQRTVSLTWRNLKQYLIIRIWIQNTNVPIDGSINPSFINSSYLSWRIYSFKLFSNWHNGLHENVHMHCAVFLFATVLSLFVKLIPQMQLKLQFQLPLQLELCMIWWDCLLLT